MAEQLSAEIRAMTTVEAALKDLADDERGRVMQWISSRFKVVGKGGASLKNHDDQEESASSVGEHSELATFFDAANPKTNAAKLLVAAYWLQFRENATDLDTQTVNGRLKHLGHGIGNITRAFEMLKAEKPASIVQTKKAGSTQQARKRFRVTTEGKKRVEEMQNAGD